MESGNKPADSEGHGARVPGDAPVLSGMFFPFLGVQAEARRWRIRRSEPDLLELIGSPLAD